MAAGLCPAYPVTVVYSSESPTNPGGIGRPTGTWLTSITSGAGAELLATPQELLDAIDRIPSMKATDTFRTPHAIWDTWVTIAALVSILAAEWWLRKRFNLL